MPRAWEVVAELFGVCGVGLGDDIDKHPVSVSNAVPRVRAGKRVYIFIVTHEFDLLIAKQEIYQETIDVILA